MIGGAVMTSLMLPLSGDLFDPPAEAIVDNLLICTAVHESAFRHRSEAAVPLTKNQQSVDNTARGDCNAEGRQR
jgi:hypothetical protein